MLKNMQANFIRGEVTMMMETILSRSLRLVFTGGAVAGIAMLAQPVLAQTADTTTAAPVQRVEITGSNIRRVDAETPSPVQVISAEDMKKSGYTSISQVLSQITANGQGTLSQGNTVAFAAGASGISLRGLDTSATLVLIDGHRVAPNAISDDNQRQFVDISNIPFDIVERVEILKDGASATYGSDAMAGVVNIILKKNFTGTSVSAEGGSSTEGGGATFHASVISGIGDLQEDGYNAYGSIEYRHQNDITQASRADISPNGGWTTLNWAPLGGISVQPGTVTGFNGSTPAIPGSTYLTNPAVTPSNASTVFLGGSCTSYSQLAAGGCAYKPLGVISPATENINVLGSFTKRLSDGWQLAIKVSEFISKDDAPNGGSINSHASYPSTYSLLPAASASVGIHQVGTSGVVTVPANYPGNTLGVAANVIGFDPSSSLTGDHVKSKASRIAVDLTGSIGEWDTQTAIGLSRDVVDQTLGGQLVPQALQAALNRTVNPYSLTGANSAADIAAIYPNVSSSAVSQLSYIEFHASRSLMALAGGDLAIATGVSYIDHYIDAPAPSQCANGVIGCNISFVKGSQADAAIFGEIVAPLTKTFELDGAARYDHFNDGNAKATPKAGFKWTPNQVIGVRGTVSAGFRAPNAAEEQASGAIYGGANYDPTYCPGGPGGNGKGNPAAGSFVASCSLVPVYGVASPTKLNPETSVAETLGLILEPVKGWSSTIDLYQIALKGQIYTPTPPVGQMIRANYPVPGFFADGNGGQVAGVLPGTNGTNGTGTGESLYQLNYYENLNKVTTSGFEIESHYKFKFGDWGSLYSSLDWTHQMSYVEDTPGGQTFQEAGTHGPSIIGGNTGNPQDRVQATFTYSKSNWDVTTAFNWIGAYKVTDPAFSNQDCQGTLTNGGVQTYPYFIGGVAPSNYCRIASFLDTDVTLRYKITKQFSVHVAANNVFNRQPPTDLSTYGGLPYQYNPSMHLSGAIGRFVQAGVNYNF